MQSLIHDEAQFDAFLDWLPEPGADERFFLSLSARSKYLNDAEREAFDLGRTEMFSRVTAHDKPGIKYALQKMQASLLYRRTRNGSEIPAKSLVVYINLDPSSMVQACQQFMLQVQKAMADNLRALQQGRTPDFHVFQSAERQLLNAIQKAHGRKRMLDIDIDTHDPEILDNLIGFIETTPYGLIKTRGGYHLLLDQAFWTAKKNIHAKCQELSELANAEVCINPNRMVPLPGTLQGGVPVTFGVSPSTIIAPLV